MEVRDGDPSRIDDLINDPDIGFQRKHDGHRRPVVITGTSPLTTVRGLNREGEPSTLPAHIVDDFRGLGGHLVLDCELLVGEDKHLMVFDVIAFGIAITPDVPLAKRIVALAWIFEHHAFGPSIQMVPTATTPEDKRALVTAVKADGGEGFVAKPLDGKYRHVTKERSPWLRFKRRAELDAVVMARGREKDHLVVGLWDGEQLVPIGTVTALAADGPIAKKDDVVTMDLMGVSPSGRMREPTNPRIRRDGKRIDQCTFDQIDAIRLTTRKAATR